MTNTVSYLDLFKSCTAFCQTFVSDMIAGQFSTDIQYFNVDQHADQHDLPSSDLLCFGNWNYMENEGTIELPLGFGISTYEDKNMMRHHELMHQLSLRLKPDVSKISVVDAISGQEKNELLVCNPISVLPVGRTESRDLQMFATVLRLVGNPITP